MIGCKRSTFTICFLPRPPTDEGTLKSPGLSPRVCSIYRGDTLERMSAPWTVPPSTKNIPSSERTGSIEQRMRPRDRRSLCFLSSPAASCCAGYARGPSPVPSCPSLLSLLDSRPAPAAVTGAHHRASQFSNLSLLVTLPALVLGCRDVKARRPGDIRQYLCLFACRDVPSLLGIRTWTI